MAVTISDRAHAVCALQVEAEAINESQLQLGEQMSKLLDLQKQLALRSQAIHQTMKELLK